MPDKIQVTIIGLSLLGSSAGMALRRHADRVIVIGHDRSPDLSASARKLGAVEKTEWNLPAATSGADRIILAVPLDEVKDTLAAMSDSLKPGCVILALSDVLFSVIAWGKETLPAEVHLVGGHPIIIADLNDTTQISPDLYKDRVFALAPDATTNETAVQLASDLVTALNAQPFFVDAQEHDVFTAATDGAASLMAAALLGVGARSRNWRDMRRLAAGQFYSSSLIMPATGSAAAAACLTNSTAVLYWLDAVMAELDALRNAVANADEDALTAQFDEALMAREGWLAAYSSGQWDQTLPLPEMPTSGSMLKSMLGIGLIKRPPNPGKR
jgi:prephenate dehydrogenase